MAADRGPAGRDQARAAPVRPPRRRAGGGAGKADSVVRVDFRRLDALLEVLGEGLIQHSALAEAYRAARRGGPARATELDRLDQAVLALEKTLKRLESTLMETRLLPIATVFGRFPRMVRDTAQAEGKRVRLLQSGGETPLDKAVLDRLSEPLLHLVTNAIVHGMESPDARLRAGKPEEGTVRLDASPQAGRVVIRVADDGRGLDEQAIRKKAEALGQELRDDDVVAAPEPDLPAGPLDGRAGVHAGGPGCGARCRGRRHPRAGRHHRRGDGAGTGDRVHAEPAGDARHRPLAHRRDRPRALRRAAGARGRDGAGRARGDPRDQPPRRDPVAGRPDPRGRRRRGARHRRGARAPRRFYVVMAAGGKRRALLVDRLVGHQDVVVKGLDPALGRPDVVSGTTILGDGRVACILDAVRILEGGRRAG